MSNRCESLAIPHFLSLHKGMIRDSVGRRPCPPQPPNLLWIVVLLLAACSPVSVSTTDPGHAPLSEAHVPLSVAVQEPSVTISPTVASTLTKTPGGTTLVPTQAAATPMAEMLPLGSPTDSRTGVLSPIPMATAISFEHNPRAILIEADLTGGPLNVPVDVHVPLFRLYADGFVLCAGDSQPLSTGLDAQIRTGQLTDKEMQELLGYLSQAGFFSLSNSYRPRPAPTDLQTAYISIYLNRVKTVEVYGPELDYVPAAFGLAFRRIIQSIPRERQTVVPVDGWVYATSAGSVSDFAQSDILPEWPVRTGVRLADAAEGTRVSGDAFASAAQGFASGLPRSLFREGNRAFRVRFAPNLPRKEHLTDWVGVLLQAPREFEGRTFDLIGYFRGANLYGEAKGGPPVTKNDWVLLDNTGAAYVAGIWPRGLDVMSRGDAWAVVRLRATLVYVRSGTSYLQARQVEVLSPVRNVGPDLATPSVPLTATIPIPPTARGNPIPTLGTTPLAPLH